MNEILLRILSIKVCVFGGFMLVTFRFSIHYVGVLRWINKINKIRFQVVVFLCFVPLSLVDRQVIFIGNYHNFKSIHAQNCLWVFQIDVQNPIYIQALLFCNYSFKIVRNYKNLSKFIFQLLRLRIPTQWISLQITQEIKGETSCYWISAISNNHCNFRNCMEGHAWSPSLSLAFPLKVCCNCSQIC